MINTNECFSVVVGLGKTGISLARYLRQKNHSFVVFDTRVEVEGLEAFRAEFNDIELFLGEFPEALLSRITAVYCSPGVPLNHVFLQLVKQQHIPLCGDIECLVREIKSKVIAITGTNGKSTVTTLVGEMAKEAGLDVAVAGNIGEPVLDVLKNGHQYDLWVLELSSFQLDLVESLVPLAATILNISNDHLDRHRDLQHYIDAKQRIYKNAQTVLFNREDQPTFPTVTGYEQAVSFGLDAPAEGHWGIMNTNEDYFLAYGAEKIMPVDALKIKGRHNWANALAACALAQAAGIERAAMVKVLNTFTGLQHRVQWVRTLDGIDWIDDSKGTNIGATASAIAGIGGAMAGKIVLIAGGQGKGADFTELRQPMTKFVRCLVLIGEDAPLLQKALEDVVTIQHSPTLEDAVRMAKKEAQRGDVVLLSPACASWDMFRDYHHRGEVFVKAVNEL